jgi:hypothetical protein
MGLYPPYKPAFMPCKNPLMVLNNTATLLWQTDVYDERCAAMPPPPPPGVTHAEWQALVGDGSALITCYHDRRVFDPALGNTEKELYYINYMPPVGIEMDLVEGGLWVSIDATEHATLEHVLNHFFGHDHSFGNPDIIIKELPFSPIPLPVPHAPHLCTVKELRDPMRFYVIVK